MTADDVARDPAPGPVARAFVAYERALADAGAIDFDDLVAGALRALDGDPALLARWRGRCAHLLVDEVQDVDRSQLRLALLLAAPANRIFLVGDDDQSIYGWRLADVRRVLGLAADLPGLRRVDLAVNYRCPAPVLARAVRLVEHNEERFAKSIRPGPGATGRLILAPAPVATDPLPRLLAAWPPDGTSRAVLARTRRELLPALAACLAGGIAFRADGVPLPLEDSRVDGLVAAASASTVLGPDRRASRRRGARGWAHAPARPRRRLGRTDPRRPRPGAHLDRRRDRRRGDRLGSAHRPRRRPRRSRRRRPRPPRPAPRRPDAHLTLATAHGTKGLEWDHVAVLGMTEGRFPSARSLADAADPARALEEERRLAYVAWTRARRSLTLVYDPAAPSPFLLEAFDAAELDAEWVVSVHRRSALGGLVAQEQLQEPVERVAEGHGVVPGQDVGDRVLGAEGRPAATRGGAQVRGRAVAQALRQGREERLPASAAEGARVREEAVGAAGGGKPRPRRSRAARGGWAAWASRSGRVTGEGRAAALQRGHGRRVVS